MLLQEHLDESTHGMSASYRLPASSSLSIFLRICSASFLTVVFVDFQTSRQVRPSGRSAQYRTYQYGDFWLGCFNTWVLRTRWAMTGIRKEESESMAAFAVGTSPAYQF
jgi:hypothetical protein